VTDIFDLLTTEEGWREKPYIDSEGFPSVGFGFLIGPKGAPLSHYTFKVPRTAGEVWMRELLNETIHDMQYTPGIGAALAYLAKIAGGSMMQDARCSVLISMAYQMGVTGLAGFKNTLAYIANGDFENAAKNMLASKWAKQTPDRAKRHAEQMRTGHWAPEYQ